MDTQNTLHEKFIPLMQELIQNKCVNTGKKESAQEIRSVKSLQRFFAQYGIKGEVFEPESGRASLLVKFPGRDNSAPSLMFMGHLDVVPADPAQWTYDPFAGVVAEDHVWGRGALDMLNMTAGQAVALAERFGKKENPYGDIYYLALADEEASGTLGAKWLTENHWEKVKADYMVTELGGFFVYAKAKTKKNAPKGILVSIGEKGVGWCRIRISGTAGHGSMPYKSDNAVVKAAEAVRLLNTMPPYIKLSPAYLAMARGLAINPLQKMLLSSKKTINWGISLFPKSMSGIAKSLHAASRMTVSPNIISAGSKVNVIADKAEVDADIRILPNQSIEDVTRILEKRLRRIDKRLKVEPLDYFPSNVSSDNTPLMSAIKDIIDKNYPDIKKIPMFIGGVTDGRYWRKKGTTVYGFTLFAEDMSLTEYANRLHGVDERVSLNSLQKTLDFFYELPESFYRHFKNGE